MRSSVSAMVILSITLTTLASHGEIPQIINYQGKVTDSTGTPVADDDYFMKFRLYDAESDGTLMWDSGWQLVSAENGLFHELLGQSPHPPIDLAFDQDYWLLVSFEGEDLLPRKRLGSVGYAYMASGLVAGTEVSGSVVTGSNSAIKAINTSTTSTVYGIYGSTASTDGFGVAGVQSGYAPETDVGEYAKPGGFFGGNNGVMGISKAETGLGVLGLSQATTDDGCGGFFMSDAPSGSGVYGEATATSGFNYGGYFKDASTSGYGVYGVATSWSGYTSGVYGLAFSTEGSGVYGYAFPASGGTHGVWGESASTSGVGVYGRASDTTGAGITTGVYGECFSTNGRAVFGGSVASEGPTHGVWGVSNSPSGYGVYYSGGLGGTGSKSCVVRTSQGPTALYCQESPECWFEDFGEGQLVDGQAHIDLDHLFLETVTIDEANPMKVFIQLLDECNGTRVVRSQAGFDVLELHGGRSNAAFMYRVVAKRQGFESRRLDYCKAAETDSYLYPELREKELRELKEERSRFEEERHRMEEQRAARIMEGKLTDRAIPFEAD